MHKPISPTLHGMLDYTTSVAVAAAPAVFDFPEPAAALAYSLAGGYTGMSMLTDYPPALKRAIPFKAHGAAEAVIGAALPALPYVLGFSKHRAARNFCFGLAALTFVVAAFTDWEG
jgi:hypothetical protein